MNIKITTILMAFTLVFVSNSVFADSVIASYTCKLKEGKTTEQVQAINSKWLKWVNKNVNKDITTSVGTAIVGKQDMFLFVDTYPDLTVWAETQTVLDTDAAIELKDIFEEVLTCSENRLWKIEATK